MTVPKKIPAKKVPAAKKVVVKRVVKKLSPYRPPQPDPTKKITKKTR